MAKISFHLNKHEDVKCRDKFGAYPQFLNSSVIDTQILQAIAYVYQICCHTKL